jgi:hypothetical protein
MPSTTFGLTHTKFLEDATVQGWDVRTVTATSYPINEGTITKFIDQACGQINTILESKGIVPDDITDVNHPNAYNLIHKTIYVMVNFRCVQALANIEAELMRGDRDRAIEYLQSNIRASLGNAHPKSHEARADKGTSHGFPTS